MKEKWFIIATKCHSKCFCTLSRQVGPQSKIESHFFSLLRRNRFRVVKEWKRQREGMERERKREKEKKREWKREKGVFCEKEREEGVKVKDRNYSNNYFKKRGSCVHHIPRQEERLKWQPTRNDDWRSWCCSWSFDCLFNLLHSWKEEEEWLSTRSFVLIMYNNKLWILEWLFIITTWDHPFLFE